jgi:hypothetical protein
MLLNQYYTKKKVTLKSDCFLSWLGNENRLRKTIFIYAYTSKFILVDIYIYFSSNSLSIFFLHCIKKMIWPATKHETIA